MPIVADAGVKIGADLSKFNNEMKGAGKEADTLGARFKSALSPTGILAGAGIAIGSAQIISFLSDATNAAAEFQDSVSATGVIFGKEAIPAMEEWGEAAASNFGASKQEALAAANVIATLGKSAGLAGDDLVNFSQEMVGLGGDLASMFGGTTQAAITAVGAALRGESEPIRRYGVLLDDATLRQKAFELGLISTTHNALTPQQKVLAAQASILEQTTDAQGDFLRTSDGMANTQREIAAELKNVTIEIGEKMMPVMLSMAQWLRSDGIPLMREFLGLLDFSDVQSAEGIPVLDEVEDFLNSTQEAALRLNDTITFHKGDIVRAAEEMGVSYMEARRQIRDAMEDFGLSHEEAVQKILPAQEAISAAATHTSDVAEAAYQASALSIHAVAVEYQRGGPVIAAEAGKIAGMLPSEIKARYAEIRAAGMESVVQFAAGILAKQNDPMLAMEALTKANEEALTRGAEIARLKGQLTSSELASGLNDGRQEVRWAAQAARAVIVDRLAGLGVEATNWGSGIGWSMANGIYSVVPVVRTAAGTLANAARGQIGILSEPKDTDSPLRGITKWGGNIVKTIADGIYGSLGTGAGAANALAGALVPSFGASSFGLATAGAASGAGGVTNQWIVNVNGVERTVSTAEEAIDVLKDLGAFGEGRIA